MERAVLIEWMKFLISHETMEASALVELKMWAVEDNEKYPEGIKYSLYCVDIETKEVIVGFDNHHPKGPHLHFGTMERPYVFVDRKKLVEDFYKNIREKGYAI